MTCKNCLAKLVWLAGALLIASLVFPNGFSSPQKPKPVNPSVVADAEIVKLLAFAPAADKARINGVYTALAEIIVRDAGQRVTTTEQWASLHANTLQLAIGGGKGAYPGLDVAIEAVFEQTLGTLDVLPGNPDTRAKLVDACEIIASSSAR